MKTLRTKVVATVLAAGLLLTTPAMAVAGRPARGALVSHELVQTLGQDELKGAFGPFSDSLAEYGVDAYRVVYRTIDAHGRPTTASGLVAFPRRSGALRVVSYTHGTRTGRDDVASMTPETMDRPAVLLIASAGYAAVAPDYLGLGVGPGFHPYGDKASEATAAADMLKAARAFAARQYHRLDRDVYLTGFSQGGQAAMELGKALRDGADPGSRVRGLAPINGPYDVQHAELPGVLDNGEVTPDIGTFYLAYWTVSMNRLHRIYDRPEEVFNPGYLGTPSLFDGSLGEDRIFPKLPSRPELLFTPAYIERMRHPSGGLSDALSATDGTCSWRVNVPIRLFAARGDTDVPIANAKHCQADLARRGVEAPITDFGAVDHYASFFRALPEVLGWFKTLK
ncbi:alpha/beta hydrolase family protein [Amycolatopsis sp. cg5]|uniref:alpha/beta hydrolase family protein n=1 Tax=Amycolatopsis sp. cg5 TaxID=3238802 RepID=UPI003524732D